MFFFCGIFFVKKLHMNFEIFLGFFVNDPDGLNSNPVFLDGVPDCFE
jgi:hypothetical protein